LTHQVISAIGEIGGGRAADLYQLLCVKGPFRDIELPLFVRLLRQLGTREIIEQMPEGDLILGTVGERLYRHFTFYAVFQTPEPYTLIHGSEKLGTLEIVPEPKQYILFAARRWLVMDVDTERKEIHVEPARGRKRTHFRGRGGMLHDHIVRKMREILLSAEMPIYLDDVGDTLLQQTRKTALEARIATRSTLPLGPNRSCLLTWSGSRIHRTLAAMMITMDVHPIDRVIGMELPMPEVQIPTFVDQLFQNNYNPEHLALAVQDLLPNSKFDWTLGPELVAIRHARQFIDTTAAQRALTNIKGSG
jgi:ATP-dependent Lhr-like helicase